MSWQVDLAKYDGDGVWTKIHPLTYDTEEDARHFETLVNINLQVGGNYKILSIHEKVEEQSGDSEQ